MVFNVTGSSAFAVYSNANDARTETFVKVTPPANEGPPRVRLVNTTTSDAWNFTLWPTVLYFESNLRPESRYQVELAASGLTPDKSFDLRYVQLFGVEAEG